VRTIVDLLRKLDQIIGELQELRAAILNGEAVPEPESAADPEPVWLDTQSAAERFDLPSDTVRWLCREKGLGKKEGGSWLVDATLLAKHMGRR
jgi:hypothetical protein